MKLKSRWFNEEAIDATLNNLIRTFDKQYLETVERSAFERDLIREVLFLSAYKSEQEKDVVKFIHDHLDGLYETAKQLSSRSPSLRSILS